MEKLYERINFENAPSKKTPLSEENLNKMDRAIYEVDNRVIELKSDLGKEVNNREVAITGIAKAVISEKNRAVERENEI